MGLLEIKKHGGAMWFIINKFRFIQSKLIFLKDEDFLQPEDIIKPFFVFFAWIAISIIFVWFSYYLSGFTNVDYLFQAVNEGIGVHLWTVVVFIGIGFFGTYILFPTNECLSSFTYSVLNNGFSIGSLTIGLELGKFLFFDGGIYGEWLTFWNIILFMFLFLLVIILNLIIWFVGNIASNKQTGAMYTLHIRINSINFKLRFVFALMIWFAVIYSIFFHEIVK